MDNSEQSAQKIREILNNRDIPTRQQNKFLAELLDLHYTSVQKKMNGQKAWTREQLQVIARHFHVPLSTLIDYGGKEKWNAILRFNDRTQRCNIVRGDVTLNPQHENFVAVQRGDAWLVVPGNTISENVECYTIRNIEILPPPRIAVLDDEHEITKSISTSFKTLGLDVEEYNSLDSFINDAEKSTFDGYIMDWVLSRTTTAEAAVRHVREVSENFSPIVILTGEIDTHVIDESDLARIVELYEVVVVEKPMRPKILATTFFSLFLSHDVKPVVHS